MGLSANPSLSNLTEVGEKHFLNKAQITNCILEAPKDIKLEFDSDTGTITLKAGSIISYPDNGVIKYATVNSDTSTAPTGNYTADVLLFANIANGVVESIYHETVVKSYSGDTPPTVSAQNNTWYDTKTGVIKRTNDSGNSWSGTKSFPIALLKYVNKYTELKQVFNTGGFIGSVFFVRKGLELLMPNYQNQDSTLKNLKYITQSHLEINIPSTYNGNIVTALMNTDELSYWLSKDVGDYYKPPAPKLNWKYYDRNTNTYRYTLDNAAYIDTVETPICNINVTNGLINSIELFSPVELVKKTDVDWVTNYVAPDFSSNVDLPKTKDLVQQADRDCYLYLVCGSGGDATVAICDADGVEIMPIINTDTTVNVATGGMTPLLSKGTYFKISYLVGTIAEFKKVYTIGGN